MQKIQLGFACDSLRTRSSVRWQNESLLEAQKSAHVARNLHGAFTTVPEKLAQGDNLSPPGPHGALAQQLCGLHMLWAWE